MTGKLCPFNAWIALHLGIPIQVGITLHVGIVSHIRTAVQVGITLQLGIALSIYLCMVPTTGGRCFSFVFLSTYQCVFKKRSRNYVEMKQDSLTKTLKIHVLIHSPKAFHWYSFERFVPLFELGNWSAGSVLSRENKSERHKNNWWSTVYHC